MLKKSRIKTYIVLFLALSMILAPVMTAYSASGLDKVQDNELVISTLGDNGSIDDIQVLSHLRLFGSGTASIEDGSNYKLSSVRNLYGKEKIEQKDNKLSISMSLNGADNYKDLYYLATLDKGEVSKVKMPVSVKVEYYLDGQKIEPSKLAGKSGHLKIVTQLDNLTGAEKTLEYKNDKGETIKSNAMVYTPYIVSLSGWEFDNKYFSNIKAPGVTGKSPEGVITDVQGKTAVSWTVPLIPPKYPASQYAVLEADAKDIKLESFKIAVIPIVPTSSETDTMSSVAASLSKLYGAFDQIQGGVGASNKDATLLFGLGSINSGLTQLSGGIGSLTDKVKEIRFGLSNPAFNISTYDSAKGTDARGNKPGVREALTISQAAVDSKLVPALEAQKQVISGLQAVIGSAGTALSQPSASTTIYNDVNFLKSLMAGTPGEAVVSQAINPKLMAVNNNLAVLKDGGSLITSAGSVAFPASVNTVEQGMQQLSAGIGKANAGVGMIVMGLGQVGTDGKPVKYLVDGKPGTILYALAYFKDSIDGQVVPGITKIIDGTSDIGTGSGEAKDAISSGLNAMAAAPAIVSALQDNAVQADSFLGKPQNAEGTVAYVYQTPEVNKEASTTKVGLGLILLALIGLFALGRSASPIVQPAKKPADF